MKGNLVIPRTSVTSLLNASSAQSNSQNIKLGQTAQYYEKYRPPKYTSRIRNLSRRSKTDLSPVLKYESSQQELFTSIENFQTEIYPLENSSIYNPFLLSNPVLEHSPIIPVPPKTNINIEEGEETNRSKENISLKELIDSNVSFSRIITDLESHIKQGLKLNAENIELLRSSINNSTIVKTQDHDINEIWNSSQEDENLHEIGNKELIVQAVPKMKDNRRYSEPATQAGVIKRQRVEKADKELKIQESALIIPGENNLQVNESFRTILSNESLLIDVNAYVDEDSTEEPAENCNQALRKLKEEFELQYLELENRIRHGLKEEQDEAIREKNITALKFHHENTKMEFERLGTLMTMQKKKLALSSHNTPYMKSQFSSNNPNVDFSSKNVVLEFNTMDYYNEMLYNFHEFMNMQKSLAPSQIQEYFLFIKNQTEKLNRKVFTNEFELEEKTEELAKLKNKYKNLKDSQYRGSIDNSVPKIVISQFSKSELPNIIEELDSSKFPTESYKKFKNDIKQMDKVVIVKNLGEQEAKSLLLKYIQKYEVLRGETVKEKDTQKPENTNLPSIKEINCLNNTPKSKILDVDILFTTEELKEKEVRVIILY